MAIKEDKYMTYDYENHIYIPTDELFLDKLGKNLEVELGQNEDDGARESLNFRTDMAYFIKDFALEYTQSCDIVNTRMQIEYDIAQDYNFQRRDLQRAYVEFARYAFNDEGDLVGLQSGVSLIKGQIVPVEQLRGRVELSSRLERILRQSGIWYKGTRAWTLETDLVYGVDY